MFLCFFPSKCLSCMPQRARLCSRHLGGVNIFVTCGVKGKTWCHTRHKSELCLREMSLWNRNDQKQEEKYFTGKPPAGPHFAGIFFYTETH